MIAGVLTALAVTGAVALALDPRCWAEYHEMMLIVRYDKISIPCISMVLRDNLAGESIVQYAPAFVGCIWAATYFWRHRAEWQWIKHGSLVLLVSLLVAPYTWFLDQCVALPALLRGLHVTRSRMLVLLLALAGAIVEIAPLSGRDVLHSNFYLWTAPAWLLWYVVACRPYERSSTYHLRIPLTDSGAQVNAGRAADL
jgi:hypothetical protein